MKHCRLFSRLIIFWIPPSHQDYLITAFGGKLDKKLSSPLQKKPKKEFEKKNKLWLDTANGYPHEPTDSQSLDGS